MLDAKVPDQDDRRDQVEAARRLPDAAVCRARAYGDNCLVNCLVSEPDACEHALQFGNAYFCCHPERVKIVARTFDAS